MKYIFLITLFVIKLTVLNGQCDYTRNEVNEFDNTIIKEVKSQMIHSDYLRGSSKKIDLSVALSQYGPKRYVTFLSWDANYFWGLKPCILKVQVKLDNQATITFNSVENSNESTTAYSHVYLKGTLLKSEIELLKKTPINIIRVYRLCPELIDEERYLDFKIVGESKNYFIQNLDCIQ